MQFLIVEAMNYFYLLKAKNTIHLYKFVDLGMKYIRKLKMRTFRHSI